MKRFPRCLSAAAIGCFVFGTAAAGQKTRAEDFVVRIENVSTPHTLHTSKGDKNVGLSPGAWALHSGDNPMYAPGARAMTGLQRLAEDGNTEGLFSDLQLLPGVKATGAFNYATAPYPVAGFIGSKQAFEFVIPDASPGDRLSFAVMFIESNDWFFANNTQGIELFSAGGTPLNGDVTMRIGLWDAGTEENEEPGVGTNQAPRQSRPDTGKSTNTPVYAIMPPAQGFDELMKKSAPGAKQWTAPDVSSVIKVTIRPRTP